VTDQPLQDGLTPEADSGDLEQVSKLILGLSRAELLALHERIEDRSKFVDHVSNTLGDAILKASDSDSFQSSIAPVVASGVLKTARREPMEMGKAIAPALGPAIRGMVTLALENMNQRIDSHIQTNFSIQGFKWRLESKKTGVPLADIVMRETLDFRVEHIMLIHQNTGTLLQEVSQPDISTKDPSVVSSMLTAVSDFVVDAFGADGSQDEAQTYRVGELTAYVERLGDLALAAVVRGTVSPKLKQILRERLESICVIFGETAHNFNGDITPFEATESMLKDCLIARAKKKEVNESKSTGRIYAGILLLILLTIVGWGVYKTKLELDNLSSFKQTLKAIPGATLIDFDSDNGISISMLLDPLSEDPKLLSEQFGYSPETINWTLYPYVSLDTRLIEARVEQLITPPSGIAYKIDQETITFSGAARRPWITLANRLATTIPGITFADFSSVQDLSLEEFEHLAQTIKETFIYFEYAHAELTEEGFTTAKQLKSKLGRFKQLATEINRPFVFYADIDPLKFSIYPKKDYARTEDRVKLLSSILGQHINLGDFKIKDVEPIQNFPYGKLRVEFEEHQL